MSLATENSVLDAIKNSEIKIKNPDFLTATQPGQRRVIKRCGNVVKFDLDRIKVAMKKAFLAVEDNNNQPSERIHTQVEKLGLQVNQKVIQYLPTGGTLDIEKIQDWVEEALMCSGEQKVARSYVLYREQRRSEREVNKSNAVSISSDDKESSLEITLPNGERAHLKKSHLVERLKLSCENLDNVDPKIIFNQTVRNLYEGITQKDINKALILSSRTAIETEPNYTYVTARLLLHDLYEEALSYLKIEDQINIAQPQKMMQSAFTHFIQRGIDNEIINPELGKFDLQRLAEAIKPENDYQFTYLSLQTLYDRYFIHENDARYELPQVFFMRVAMGLAIAEPKDREAKAIEFYNLLSSFDFMSSTPTLFNAGTVHSQLSSCFLTTIADNLEGIYGAIKDNAMLSKWAGGLGNDWTPVRPMGAHIKGTNGKSLGVVPFLNVADATAVAVNQGGKRKGAVCAFLETWHLDIEEFLELRKNTGDDRRRTHDMNTANWIPDLFMKRVFENKDWTLFASNETPDLHETYGAEFEALYTNYEAQAAAGKIQSKTIPAKNLWRKMLTMVFETGHPWLTFKDPCNLRSPQQHVGVVHSSNLCTEITLNTSEDEIAVCNLGSINLAKHVNADGIDNKKLEKTIKTAIRMLDNVIDINYYSVPQARNSNLKHRPIGIGIMGFQDALYKIRAPYGSEKAVECADEWMEAISYHAIMASAKLAEERGSYQTFEGSLWSQGILPIDSIEKLAETRGKYLEINREQRLDWDTARKHAKRGMRNSNLMAIAPTATISNICGVTQSIEPTYQNLFVKSNLSGEFTVINQSLADDLKALNLWDTSMVHDLKYYNGSVKNISRIPNDLKKLYATAFEVDAKWLIDAASRRQKWIDQAQSLNLYIEQPSGKKLDTIYKYAWLSGLKTTYYLRSLGATNSEKATIRDDSLNAVNKQAAPQACSINDPDCDACQ